MATSKEITVSRALHRQIAENNVELKNKIINSGFFDAEWYSTKYPDVAILGVEPLDHFLRFGGILRRSPSEYFDTAFYIDTYPDVVASGKNPLVEFLENGQEQGRRVRADQGRFALIVHAFHIDVIYDMTRYIANFPEDADQFVTHPDFFDATAVAFLRRSLPRATLVAVPNAGQDVGALIALSRKVDLTGYEAICKIHTKKGAKEAQRWRNSLLRGVLASKAQVNRIINEFNNDPQLILAGPRQLFLHGPTYMWKNAENLKNIFTENIGNFNFVEEDWGFFGGTCFWIRGSALQSIKSTLFSIEFLPSAYTDDGVIAHSVERMFGMVATLRGGRVLLNDVERSDAYEIIGPGFPASGVRERIMISDILQKIRLPDGAISNPKPRGNIDISSHSINGWLAVNGDETPREGILKIGDIEIPFTASLFRADLKGNGVNQGKHAFSVPVPGRLYDDKAHEVVLIDKQTGVEIARKTRTWNKKKREYWDLQGFLKSSMTLPEVEIPFAEEDKRVFAVMEGIANKFATRGLALKPRPLVSIVMPVFNRAGIVAEAIKSVLKQTYGHFELLVVDDGSSDDSVAVVSAFSDPRIRLIELPENRGVTIARNTALNIAQGDIISYLDSDNTWDERYLAAQVGAFDTFPDADIIYSGALLYRGDADAPFAVRYGHFNRSLLENKNYIDNNVISHRRALLQQLGSFSDDLRRFVDYDFILRAADSSKIISVPMLLCNYFYEKADNTITNNQRHASDMLVVRERLLKRKTQLLAELDKIDLVRPVAVVIPNWESLDDIRECIDTLHSRSWNGLLDIIVVDNNSSEPVRAYLESESQAGRIIFIPLGNNFGFTHASNVGIVRARPDSDILLLNNDAIAQPGAIQALQRSCLSKPNIGMTVPRQILPAGTKTITAHVPFAFEHYDCDVNISAHHRNIAHVPLFHDGGDLELSYAAFFAVYIRREVIDAIGPLDAEYGRHYRSDRVYCDMMRNLTDYRLFYVPDSHFIHKLQKSTEHLRAVGQTDESFKLMFVRNQWDAETARELDFRFAAWDIFT